jgi:hypothetical protein
MNNATFERQYDALSKRYVAGLCNSMEVFKEFASREVERVKELFADGSENAADGVHSRSCDAGGISREL